MFSQRFLSGYRRWKCTESSKRATSCSVTNNKDVLLLQYTLRNPNYYPMAHDRMEIVFVVQTLSYLTVNLTLLSVGCLPLLTHWQCTAVQDHSDASRKQDIKVSGTLELCSLFSMSGVAFMCIACPRIPQTSFLFSTEKSTRTTLRFHSLRQQNQSSSLAQRHPTLDTRNSGTVNMCSDDTWANCSVQYFCL
jgi:hypothetical protein